MLKDAMQKPEVSFWMAIIIPLLGLAVQWGTLNSSLTNLAEKEARLRQEYDSFVVNQNSQSKDLDVRLLQMEVKLAEIQKDIVYIRSSVGDK